MNIAFIHPSAEMGGAARSLMDTIACFRRTGAGCRLFVPSKGSLQARADALGVPVDVVELPPWLGYWVAYPQRPRAIGRCARAGWALASRLKAVKPDVVYSNTLITGVGGFAAHRAGLPHLWHIREFGWEDHKLCYLLGRSLTLRLVDRWSASIVTNSRAVAEALQPPVSKNKVHVVHQGVRQPDAKADARAPERNAAFRVVIVGIVHEGKGQLDAVRAIQGLLNEGLDVELLIAGRVAQETYYRQIERHIAAHDLGHRIHLLGNVDYAGALMKSADIVLMCSDQEAFGRVTVEAMLAGKPVIGTDSGGTPEIVEDGVTGLLYPPGDHAALAQRIRALLEQPERCRAMGLDGRLRAEALFSMHRYESRLTACVEALCSGIAS